MSIEDKASEYVCKNGQYLRDGVYAVRYPPYATRAIIADDTHKLTAEVAKRMREEAAA